MIAPKVAKLTEAEKTTAYELATLRDDGMCVMRGLMFNCMGAAHRDHRQNRDDYNTTPSNLQCLCLLHHQWKTEHPKAAIAGGWGMPRNTLLNPAEWPARRWVRSALGLRLFWVLYDDAGEWTAISDEDAAQRMGRA